MSAREALSRALAERGIGHHMDAAETGVRVWLTPDQAAELAEALSLPEAPAAVCAECRGPAAPSPEGARREARAEGL